jgi:hypothetical protein
MHYYSTNPGRLVSLVVANGWHGNSTKKHDKTNKKSVKQKDERKQCTT